MASSSIPAIHFVAATLVIVLLLAPASVTGLKCSDVIKYVRPCISYLKGGQAGTPPAACCAGVKGLSSTAATTASRQTACKCFKSASKNLNPKPDLLKSLPGNCGVSLPFVLSPNADCSKIST